VTEAARELGTINLLVSNAGITGPFAPIWDADPDEWWRTQEVHVRGAFLCARAVWPGMAARGGGRIILVASRAAERGGANLSAYQIAKAGQLRMAEALAAEGADIGIRAFALHPGLVDTQFADEPLTRADAQKYAGSFVARLRELKRDPSRGTPIGLVASLCVFLGSGRGDALSGRYFRVEEACGCARCRSPLDRPLRCHRRFTELPGHAGVTGFTVSERRASQRRAVVCA
jgi:NAD(P)-dependent dehydrogenase (short-subunit alcohol dehydrogenase family)